MGTTALRALCIAWRRGQAARVLDLKTDRDGVEPKGAATIIVVRDGVEGLEVYCVKRHSKSGFLGGAVVFPGGKVDEADRDPHWNDTLGALHPRSDLFAGEPGSAFHVAACRETFEEARVLLTEPNPTAEMAGTLRARLGARPPATAFRDLMQQEQLTLQVGRLRPFAHWITPAAEARRFDTRFFLTALPEGQVARHDDHETTSSFWGRPHDILKRWTESEIFLAPPTARALEILIEADSEASALALADRQPLDAILPHFLITQNVPTLALPGDKLYPEERAPVFADGPTRYVLRDGRFVGERDD